jgi:hypothetical protein
MVKAEVVEAENHQVVEDYLEVAAEDYLEVVEVALLNLNLYP